MKGMIKAGTEKDRLYDRAVDGAYLVSSVMGYENAVDGHAFSITGESLTLDVVASISVTVFSVVACYFPRVAKARETCREALSGLKNGRHAVVNALSIVNMMAHLGTVFSILSPEGALACAMGLFLMFFNSWRLQHEREQQRHIQALAAYLNQASVEFSEPLKVHQPQRAHQKRLIALQVFHGTTDGLYCAGNVLKLGLLFCAIGHPVGGIAVGIVIAMIFMMVMVISTNYYVTQSKMQHFEHRKCYAQATYKAMMEGKSLQEAHNRKLQEIVTEQALFEKTRQYRLYHATKNLFTLCREAVNYVKNSGDATDNVVAMVMRRSLAQAATLTDVSWIGLLVAMPSLLLMLYRHCKTGCRPSKINSTPVLNLTQQRNIPQPIGVNPCLPTL